MMGSRAITGLLAAMLLAGCAGSSGTTPAESIEVVNCGTSMRLPALPQRIVAMEGAAETLFSLGAGDRMAGWFGAEPAELPARYRSEATRTTRLGGGWPAPSLEALTAPGPDLVVLPGYAPDAGVTRARLAELGIPSFVLSEGCEPPKPRLAAFYDDTVLLARLLGDESGGRALVASWRAAIAEATRTPLPARPSVLVSHAPDPAKPMVYGSGSLAHDIVVAAGGRNAFADTARALATPGWEEVLGRNPDVVVDAGSPPALRSYLRKDPALAGMSVVRSDRFLTLEYEQTVPGPRAVDGVLALARYLRAK